MFAFKGEVLASKSWLNRALIIQFYNSKLNINGDSISDDVVMLKRALKELQAGSRVFDLGMGGTTFRFFTFLVSRQIGQFTLQGHPRLFERPQGDMIHILKQLGVEANSCTNKLEVFSSGWAPTAKLNCAAEYSSQFLSGLLLSCWNLEFDLEIEIQKPITSYGYLQMTIDILRQAGMSLELIENEKYLIIQIKKNQKISVQNFQAELDVSSAFALTAAGVINGEVQITNWNLNSKQPDLIFLELLDKMKIKFTVKNNSLTVVRQSDWKALNCNLSNSPDLFPVLAALCAFAEGVSTLSGAEQLVYKESNRILKTYELLCLMGFRCELHAGGLTIYGKSSSQPPSKPCKFNPDHDHRMAMAAALFKLKSYNIEIEHPEVVNKSYPDFWKDIGLKP